MLLAKKVIDLLPEKEDPYNVELPKRSIASQDCKIF